jgi:hypothetical protein
MAFRPPKKNRKLSTLTPLPPSSSSGISTLGGFTALLDAATSAPPERSPMPRDIVDLRPLDPMEFATARHEPTTDPLPPNDIHTSSNAPALLRTTIPDVHARATADERDEDDEDADDMTPSAYWTAKGGKCPAPMTDDYTKWSTEQLRHECTARDMHLPRKTPKDVRIRELRKVDEINMHVAGTADEEARLPAKLRKTMHCGIRFLNVAFSDAFCDGFAATGDKAKRADLDAGQVNGKTAWWYGLTDAYRNNTTDYNKLWTDDLRFSHLDPSVIIRHPTAKLYDIWTGIRRKYAMALVKFTRLGTHESDFFEFCDGNLDVAYLHVCLQVKPNLTSFVEGGFLPGDELDTGRPGGPSPTDMSTTAQLPKWQQDLVSSINRVTDLIAADTQQQQPDRVSNLLDCISKLQQLVEQVERRLDMADPDAKMVADLHKSLALYNRRIHAYEMDLMDAM